MAVLRTSLWALALSASQVLAQTTDPASCAAGVHVISVRGASNQNPPYGLSTTTVYNITAAVVGSDVVSVDYNNLLEPVIYAAIKGGRHTKRWIRRYVRSCPNTAIVVQGYSQGAIAVMTGLCGGQYQDYPAVKPLEPEYTKNIIGVVTYGDETRNAEASYNEGTCTANSAHPRTTWECGDLTDKIKSWCDSGDGDCCLGGTDPNAHSQYPRLYNAAVVTWILEQWALWKGTSPPPYYPPDTDGPPRRRGLKWSA